MSKISEKIKDIIYIIKNSRLLVFSIVFVLLSVILIEHIFVLQIVNGNKYLKDYRLQIKKERVIQGTRGNIYDRNGVLLATNKLAYKVTIEDNGSYDTLKEKNKVLNKTILDVIDILKRNDDTIIEDFGIVLDDDNKYTFKDTSDALINRFKADIYGYKNISQLKEKQKNQSASDLMNYICTDKTYGYGIDQEKYSKSTVLEIVNVRYHIALNAYQKYITATIANDVSDETVADIKENSDSLQGVNIEQTTLREYPGGKYYSSLIGYTGTISSEDYNALSEKEKKKYSLTDTVGQAGIEEYMDSYLQGEKGNKTFYVNNVGKILESSSSKNPKPGNNVYLSIDANLQKATYQILEQELAGIVYNKLVNSLTFNKSAVKDPADIKIPIGDAYYQLIGNNLIDYKEFSSSKAGANEKAVYSKFTAHKKSVLNKIVSILNNEKAPAYKDMNKEMQAYFTYIITDYLTTNNKILSPSNSDSLYKNWSTNENINPYTYLFGSISKNWIDTGKISEHANDKYTDAKQTYQDLVNYIKSSMENDDSFNKLIYKYMIKSGTVTGKEVCMILYEQNFFDKSKDSYYERLSSGSLSAYDFIRACVKNIKITPGELALEPCTGSMVITSPVNGDVLACVSYPGYDNNRLSNNMDTKYYNNLLSDGSRPFYNNATQEKTAPGSTYKPLMACIGLTEGVINSDTMINCTGVFKKVFPNPKCWDKYGHGYLNCSGAIDNSCNVFFYETGYRLGLSAKGLANESIDNEKGDATNKYYSSDLGIEKITKYAKEFGLGEKSGLEIPEASPKISDADSVLSSIGQGTNNYTVSQLTRYVNVIASSGSLYKFSLLNKVTSNSGKTVKTYNSKLESTVDDVSASTWSTVHTGMRAVVTDSHSSTFSKLDAEGVHIAGKTGTAQQSKTNPDHALFIGYAPYDNPEISFGVRIANGYSSTYAAEVTTQVMKYYFKSEPVKKIITGKAYDIAAGSTEG